MLITTTTQFREHVPVSALTHIATLQPYIREAEVRHIRPVLGDDLYTVLETAGDTHADEVKRLLDMVRAAVANLAMFSGFDMLNVQFDETGFTRSSVDKTLYRYQEENLKNSFRNKGFDFIDAILEYLQENVSSFESFTQSPWYVASKGSFFHTTSQFNAIYNINHSRLVFVKIAAYFSRVIDFEIIPVLGQTLYDKVIAEMAKTANQNDNLLALIPYIRKPLAFLAVHAAMLELNYNITDKGMVVEKQTAIGNSHIDMSPLDINLFEMARSVAKLTGGSYLNMLLTYLSNNRDKYPDYVQNITHTNPLRRNNTGKKTIWL